MESIPENRASTNRPLEAAPEIASKGYPVFPTTPDGKAPTVEGGFYQATTKLAEIEQWIREHWRKNHGVAFPTGVLSGVVVIDADDAEATERMRAKYGEPAVLSSHEHSGGAHWYFKHPRNGKVTSNSGVQPGIDRKGDGGYVLTPPSKGKVWVNGIPEIDSLPVLPREFWSKGNPVPRNEGPAPRTESAGVADETQDKAAEAIARHVSAMTPGGRHDHMVAAWGLLLNKGLDADVVEDMLIAAWEQVGGDLEDRAATEIPNAGRTTLEQIRTGQHVKGGPSMDKLTPGLLDELYDIFGWSRGKSQDGEKKGNQGKRLVGYAMDDASELFVDQNGTEHALVCGVPVPLDSKCYGWLRRLFWEHEGSPAATDLLGTAAGQLRAFAEVSGNTRTLHLRAAQHEGAVYLYLRPGRVVRVDAWGWEIDPNPPVMFRRVANLKDLPDPERGGSLDLLDDFITAQEPRDHRLAKAWVSLALLADINRPILLAHGPQGATKSSVQRVLKNVIDPGRPETLKLREKDFEQNINKAFIPFFDNISNITDYMGDELSKAVTGAGNAVRKLYADDEDVIREYRRAILLNGLTIPTDKPDLIDRILPVALRRVPKEERKTERRMRALFEERHPKLLGAVLDALSGAMAYHEEVEGLPRLADWAAYAIALYKHLDWGGYAGFMKDWAVIEEGQHSSTLDSSVLAQAVVALVDEHGDITRAPKEMLELLRNAAHSEGLDPDRRDSDFPGGASVLSKRLVPLIPTLEALRIKVEDGRENSKARKRFIRFSRVGQEPDSFGQVTDSSASDESRIGTPNRTGRTARTALFPENSKNTENRIYNGHDDTLLQSGKSPVRTVRKRRRRWISAYLSQPESDSSNAGPVRQAVRNEGGAVRNDGDDPKAEPPERGRERAQWELDAANRRARREQNRHDNDPARYHDLPAEHRERLRTWVRENVALRHVTRSAGSYQLKHIAERFFRERGEHDPYVSNAAIKGALIEAGYEPVEEDEHHIMYFRVGPKPGSEWADRPHGPGVLGPPLFYESVSIPEYPASRAARRMRRQQHDQEGERQ